MRTRLKEWVNKGDVLHHLQYFGIPKVPLDLGHIIFRRDDYYISLVGELFNRLRFPYEDRKSWSYLGNSIIQAGIKIEGRMASPIEGVVPLETALYAATAFYIGGFPASAYLALREIGMSLKVEEFNTCYELLCRPDEIRSLQVLELKKALLNGKLEVFDTQLELAELSEAQSIKLDLNKWIESYLFKNILRNFKDTNLRSVLPDGGSPFWNLLIESFVNRRIWEFFPSQIQAIRKGLLVEDSSFSLQMPTGSGKTALTETLLFYHLRQEPSRVAILLVPYRSLASELRYSIVKRLNQMGIPARCAYGGTVPTGDEIHAMKDVRAIIATPEAISGILSSDPNLMSRISLVICDEGHILDADSRGVGLELLLARFRGRENRPPKFVFISAIVPNIEEINAWLGGTDKTALKSDYIAAHADFAILDANRNGVSLKLNPQMNENSSYIIKDFLERSEFQYLNSNTNRLKTYPFGSIKTQAIASARKTLYLGTVAIFAINKRGHQGAIGLAKELLSQLKCPLALPIPLELVEDMEILNSAIEYFCLEYGPEWIGTSSLRSGFVLHHGDIPQETREIIEELVRKENVKLIICTKTLAEGINLPIRTLIIYSLSRRTNDGQPIPMLYRDIKNLIGRVGRAGSTTKGLVLCANEREWPYIKSVANHFPSESIFGSLHSLLRKLNRWILRGNYSLTNEILEGQPLLYSLIDGIDSTLMDLIVEEIGEDEFLTIATDLSAQTYAARNSDIELTNLMKNVFRLRAGKIIEIKNKGRLQWIRETGARARMLEIVERSLLPLQEKWDNIDTPTDTVLITLLVDWAWRLPEMERAVTKFTEADPLTQEQFSLIVELWIRGASYIQISHALNIDIDKLLNINTSVLAFVFQDYMEQGIGLLKKYLENQLEDLSPTIENFPEYLRFGVSTEVGLLLKREGIRYRRAIVALENSPEFNYIDSSNRELVLTTAYEILQDHTRWLPILGQLVYEGTLEDLSK